MGYDPQVHHRRSIRLAGYDYAQAGAYFVTICTHGRRNLFGAVVDEAMEQNDAGRMVQTAWEELPQRFPDLEMDTFVVMPNHIHGIIVIPVAADEPPIVRAGLVPAPPVPIADGPPNTGDGEFTGGAATLGDIVGAFKSWTTV